MTTTLERDALDPEHARLAAELSAYLDGELASERAGKLEAHLAGCARCRAELKLLGALRDRLRAEPLPALPTGLQARLHGALLLAAPPSAAEMPAGQRRARDRRRRVVARSFAWGGWALAAALALVLLVGRRGSPTGGGRESTPVTASLRPQMVDAALVDYAERLADELPPPPGIEELEARVGFPIRPLPGAQLISAWVTSLRGEAAAALAYRAGRLLVVQYVVSSDLFFRNPALRAAVDRSGHYVTEQGSTAVVCYPDEQSGSLLIGAADAESLLALAQPN